MSDRIPVFIPSLAEVLAFAEKKKGSRLTQAETIAIRDKAPCIVMEAGHAKEMATKRGFVDVNPENCWADWHRLRTQFTGEGYLPKIVLCMPGRDLETSCGQVLKAAAVEYKIQPRDERMADAFRKSSVTWPSLRPGDYDFINGHSEVLYVLSKNYVAGEAGAMSRAFLRLGRRLLEAGGVAIKCESSGIAHSRERWVQFDSLANGSASEKWAALFHAYVVNPVGSDSEVYSCGMHLLGAPDLIVAREALRDSVNDGTTFESAAVELFRIFGQYLLAECPTGKFASGHTFSTKPGGPRFRVLWEPCSGYEEDDFFFNPFGRWRFTLA